MDVQFACVLATPAMEVVGFPVCLPACITSLRGRPQSHLPPSWAPQSFSFHCQSLRSPISNHNPHRPPCFSVGAGQSLAPTEDTQHESAVKVAKSLDNVEVLDLNGNSIPVTDLWKERKVVVGFTRHFGCVLCMKRADLLASHKMEMDAANVSLIIVGPGNVEQAQSFARTTSFPGEVYADPSYSTHKALEFVSGIGSTFSPKTGMRVLSAYLEGYRQDWGLSFQRDTVSKGGWQQGGVLVAGPGKHRLLYLFKDEQAGDEPNMDDIVTVCCKS